MSGAKNVHSDTICPRLRDRGTDRHRSPCKIQNLSSSHLGSLVEGFHTENCCQNLAPSPDFASSGQFDGCNHLSMIGLPAGNLFVAEGLVDQVVVKHRNVDHPPNMTGVLRHKLLAD